MGGTAGGGGRVERRDASTRVALGIKVFAAAGALAIALVREGLPGTVLVLLLGIGLAALTRRRKAAPVPGAEWTASADLLLRGRQFPGQISVLPDAIIWRPSRYSLRHGAEEFRSDSRRGARVSGGTALGATVLTLTSIDGTVTTFLTHGSRRLAEAIAGTGTGDAGSGWQPPQDSGS